MAFMKSPNKICKFCQIPYYVKPYLLPTSQYCSLSCKAKYQRVQVKINCLICKKLFEHISSRCNKVKYCSNKCRYIAHRNKGKTEYKCNYCHKKFNAALSTKRKYCSRACVNKSSKDIFKPVYSTVRKMMIRRNLLKSCQRCGFNEEPKILGVHHKDRNRHNNEMSNLEILCPNCHSLEHLKHISHGFRE